MDRLHGGCRAAPAGNAARRRSDATGAAAAGGRIELRREGGELELATQNLAFSTEAGQRWPGGNLRYRETRAPDGGLRGLLLQGDRLDLLALRQLAGHLPLPASGRDWLLGLQTRWLIEQLDLQWRAGQSAQGSWKARVA